MPVYLGSRRALRSAGSATVSGGASGFPVDTFGADLHRWIDASNAGSFSLSGSNIVTVTDLSAHAATLTMTGTTAFTRAQDSSNSNRYGINCGAGSSNAYLLDATVALGYITGVTAIPFTVIAACRAVTTTSAQAVTDGVNLDCTMYVTSDTWNIYAGASQVTGGSADTAAVLLEGFYDGTGSYMSVDGASAVTGAAGNSGLDGLVMGNNRAHNGKFSGFIYELILVNREVTPTELTDTIAYLAAKWQ